MRFKKFHDALYIAPLSQMHKENYRYSDYDKFELIKNKLGRDIFNKFRFLQPPYDTPLTWIDLKESLNKLHQYTIYNRTINMTNAKSILKDPTHTEAGKDSMYLITPKTRRYNRFKSSYKTKYKRDKFKTRRKRYDKYKSSNKSSYKSNYKANKYRKYNKFSKSFKKRNQN